MADVRWDSQEEAERLAAEILKPVDHAEFAKKVTDKRFTFYVSLASRMGASALSALVEFRIFHPTVGPESNDDFLYYRILIDDAVPFFVFAVPLTFEARVVELAKAIHMEIVKGYPIVIGSKGAMKFPGYKEGETGRHNLYTIENGKGSQIYLNRPDLNDGIVKREGELIDLLMRYGYQVSVATVRDYLWGLMTGKSH